MCIYTKVLINVINDYVLLFENYYQTNLPIKSVIIIII